MMPFGVEYFVASFAARQVGRDDDKAIVAIETASYAWTIALGSRSQALRLAKKAKAPPVAKLLRSSPPAGHVFVVYIGACGRVGLALVKAAQGAESKAVALKAFGGVA